MYKYKFKKITVNHVCIFYRYFVKEQKTSRIFKYDKPPELEEHEKRIQQSGIHEQFQSKE